MSLDFEMKTFCVWKGVISKESLLTNCAKMRILKMGVPRYKMASCIILHVLLNILSIYLLSKVHDTASYFETQKDKSCHFTF